MTAQILDPVPLSSLVAVPIQHDGQVWPLYRVDAGEPVIRDIDWAEKLGYERPRKIRDLIKTMAESGSLGEVICTQQGQNRASDGTTRGRPSMAYLLTKAQALKVAARSDTKFADALLDAMIAVFLKVTGQAEHTMPAMVPTSDPVPRDSAEHQLQVLELATASLRSLHTKQKQMQEEQATLANKVAEIDARTQPKPKKVRAKCESPSDREELVIGAIKALGEEATTRRIAERCDRTPGQIKGSLTVLKATSKIEQRGTTREPNWVLVEKRPANVIPLYPGKPTDAEMEVALSWREKLYNYVEAAAEQECLRTKKNTQSERADVFRDHWNRLFASAAQEGMECRGRESVGKPVPRIEYAEAKGWCEPILRRCAMRLFRIESMPVPRPSDIACHSEVR